jgi:hypothetical protein
MSDLSAEDWMDIIAISAIFMWGIAILLFGRISVKHIEREMAKEGILPPLWDKGIGMRYPAYASIIMRPNAKRHASTVDIEATKRLSRRIDWYLAVFVQVSSAIIFTVLVVFYFFSLLIIKSQSYPYSGGLKSMIFYGSQSRDIAKRETYLNNRLKT